MNSGFEDCRVLIELIEEYSGDWDKILPKFQVSRKPNTDAIADLALKNFIEMRDKVTDPDFLKRKKLEARIHQEYPEDWLPLYSMVTFSDTPYADAQRLGKLQEQVLNRAKRENYLDDLPRIVDDFNALKKDVLKVLQ